MDDQGRSVSEIELLKIDAKRWAFLHLPLGGLLAVAVLVLYLVESRRIELELLAVVLLIPATVIPGVWALAWLQATLFNLFVSVMRGGPIVLVAERAGKGSRQRE